MASEIVPPGGDTYGLVDEINEREEAEARRWVKTEMPWLAAVRDKELTTEGLYMLQVVATFARPWRPHVWPGDALLARTAGVSIRTVQRRLEELQEAGWITRSEDKNELRMIKVRRSRVSQGEPPATPDVAERATPHLADRRRVQDEEASSSSSGSGSPSKDTRLRRGRGAPSKRAQALGEELLSAYPHGLRASGRMRKPSTSVVATKLDAILRGLGDDAAAEVASAILKGARLEAHAATRDRAADPDDVRFQKDLVTWLNQRCWESPPEFVGVGQVATGSPVIDSYNASVARAERERAARDAADPRPIRTEPIRRRPIEEIRAEAEARARKALALSRANDRDVKPHKMPNQEPNETGGAA